MSDEDTEHRMRLRWRGVDDPCLKCEGRGVRWYGSTSTWRGGMGAAMITWDVCDVCWGSGDRYRHGCDLRQLRDEESKRVDGMMPQEADAPTLRAGRSTSAGPRLEAPRGCCRE